MAAYRFSVLKYCVPLFNESWWINDLYMQLVYNYVELFNTCDVYVLVTSASRCDVIQRHTHQWTSLSSNGAPELLTSNDVLMIVAGRVALVVVKPLAVITFCDAGDIATTATSRRNVGGVVRVTHVCSSSSNQILKYEDLL